MKRRDLKPGDVFIAPEQRSGGRSAFSGERLTVVDQRTEVDEHGQKWAFGDVSPVMEVEVKK